MTVGTAGDTEAVVSGAEGTRGGGEVAAGPLAELGTASDNAGESCAEYSESSGFTADTDAADDSMGLVTDG